MTLSALMIHGMIRKHLKSTNSVHHLKYIKKECTFEDIIYKMSIFEERGQRGNTSSPEVCHSIA